MKPTDSLTPQDRKLLQRLAAFVPPHVFDIHAHLFRAEHFIIKNLPASLQSATELDLSGYQYALAQWLPNATVDGLFFGFPSRDNDRPAINRWVAAQLKAGQAGASRALALVSPQDDPAAVADQVRELGSVGLKPYHVYAPLADTGQAAIEQFAPEWMWELCDAIHGVLMLHIVKPRAIADPDNQAALRRLCRQYPRCRLVLAHVARSFCYRHARAALPTLLDLDNVWVDTAAVTETESIRCAIETLGPKRVLFGSDYPISQLRGRCVALGEAFAWIQSDATTPLTTIPPQGETLIGLESLLCLREAAADAGLTPADVTDIFRHNALRLLAPHLPPAAVPPTLAGPELWSAARQRISCGTGLLSKRAERFDPQSWPAYFSRCRGSDVWDANGRRYLDFTGGVGAVFLGYADGDVTRAVKRRLNLGTYCTLCSPDEVELADLLLELHPWAQRVRYARGGGEALAVAVRIARAATGRSGIAFCGYHGWQDWYLAANLADDSALDGHLLPGLQPLGVPRELKGTAVPFRYNDLPAFEHALAQLAGNFAGVVMEPLRAQRPQPGFLETVAQRCRAAGGVFLVDEVTSGWRFGFPGALPALGIEPDVVVYAKALSNGFPCAAIVGRAAVMDAANPSFISSSYWTEGVGPAAALAAIGKMRAANAQAVVWNLGEQFQQQLRTLAARHPATKLAIGGQPCAPSLAFELGANAAAAKQLLIRRMASRGFLVSSQLYLMFTHTAAQCDGVLAALDPVLAELSQLLEAGRLQAEAGPTGEGPAAMGFARLA